MSPLETPPNPINKARLWRWGLVLGVVSLLGLGSLWLYSFQVVEEFNAIQATEYNNSIFYDIDRRPFHVIKGEEDRKYTQLDHISRNLQMAVVAVEDARFFKHFGFDPIRLLGASLRLLQPEASLHGASTITQQLVKLSLLSPERTLSRKLKELFLAISLEIHFSKAQILEFYLNKVYLGHRNYGVENAALNYFHKSSKELSLAESALIAGLIKKPEGYSPFNNLKGARSRQLLVLGRMRTLGWISEEDHRQAVNERILIRKRRQADLQMAPFFTNNVLNLLKNRYTKDQIFGGGLHIYTTLNRGVQAQLEQVIANRMKEEHSFNEAAALSMDPATGFVQGLVGGVDFNQSEFNRVTQAKRQPGSAFKPILYATALTRGVRSNDVFVDEPVQYNLTYGGDDGQYYEPKNFNNEYRGPMTVAQALKLSNNVVAVQVLQRVGVPALVHQAERFGFQISKDMGLCLALGCGEVTLEEMVTAYGSFANNGQMNLPVFILKVTDSTGRVLEEYKPLQPVAVLTANQAHQLNHMLQAVINEGTGRAAKLDEPAGGKTGTTNDHRDAWFVGFTPDNVAGFWIGNDDNSPMTGEVWGRTPARLWKEFMSGIQRNKEKTFPLNPEYEEFLLCDISGKLANSWCEETSWYTLRRESVPVEYCDVHDQPMVEAHICAVSKKLATEGCPEDKVVKQRFLAGKVPQEYCDLHGFEAPLEGPAPATAPEPGKALGPTKAFGPEGEEFYELPEITPDFGDVAPAPAPPAANSP